MMRLPPAPPRQLRVSMKPEPFATIRPCYSGPFQRKMYIYAATAAAAAAAVRTARQLFSYYAYGRLL
jgi:hypothetical protein